MKLLKAMVFGIGVLLSVATLMAFQEPCSDGCTHVIMEHHITTGQSIEYDLFHAIGNYTTTLPDGGALFQDQISYQYRTWPVGNPQCSPCNASCLGSATVAFEPTEWVPANGRDECKPDTEGGGGTPMP